MTSSVITNLSKILSNTSAFSGFSRFPELYAINLDGDPNQYYDYKNMLIFFDNSSECVKIKYSEIQSESAYLNKFSYNKAANYIQFLFFPYKSIYTTRFRQPKIGDYVAAYDRDEKITYKSKISSINTKSGSLYLYLADNTFLDKVIVSKHPLIYFLISGEYSDLKTLVNPTLYYRDINITDNIADVYIPYDRISSLEFNKVGFFVKDIRTI